MIVYLTVQITEHFGQSKYRTILVSLTPYVVRKQICPWTHMMPINSVLSQFIYGKHILNIWIHQVPWKSTQGGKKERECKFTA